jgi:hypothetical protein
MSWQIWLAQHRQTDKKTKQQNEPLQQFKVTASTVGPSFPNAISNDAFILDI